MDMKRKCGIACVFFLSALLMLPAMSMAEEAEGSGLEGYITGGGVGIDLDPDESYKFGEYTGVTEDGYGIGEFDVRYDGKDNFYMNLEGKNIGRENREMTLKIGKYGSYDLSFNYDKTPHRISNNSMTIFNGIGSEVLSLPQGFTRGAAANSGTLATSLDAYKKGVNTYTDRDSGTIGISMRIMEDVDFSASYKREEKEGVLSLGQAIGTGGGGTTRAIILPRPVDFSNDTVNASLAYKGEIAQAILTYYYSRFENNKDSITWENPFTGSGSLAGLFPTAGKSALEPSSDHHRFGLSGGMDFGKTTRINIMGEYGIMEQNENLLPYSNNPNSTISTALPRTKAEARIETANLSVNLSSRPITNLALNIKYKFYSTDNETPQDTWLKARNDIGEAQQTITSSSAKINQPYDYTKNEVSAGASYNFYKHSTFKLGYKFVHMNRDLREAEETEEHTFLTGLRSRISTYAHISINYSHSMRDYNSYDQWNEYSKAHSADYVAAEIASSTGGCGVPTDLTDIDCWGNHPYLRKFDLADRDRDKVSGSLIFTPFDMLTIGGYANYGKDDYNGVLIGLQESETFSATVDVTYTPAEYLTIFSFYTREDIDSIQKGRDFRGNAKAADSVDSTRDWWANHDDGIDTVGAGVNLILMDNKLNLRGDYSFSQSTSEITFRNGGYENALDMVDINTKLHTFSITGDYKLTSNWAVGAGYRYEDYNSKDWQTDTWAPASSAALNDVIFMGGSSPDYEAHSGMLYFTYFFGEGI